MWERERECGRWQEAWERERAYCVLTNSLVLFGCCSHGLDERICWKQFFCWHMSLFRLRFFDEPGVYEFDWICIEPYSHVVEKLFYHKLTRTLVDRVFCTKYFSVNIQLLVFSWAFQNLLPNNFFDAQVKSYRFLKLPLWRFGTQQNIL